MTKIRRNDGVVIDWRAEVFDPPAIDHSVGVSLAVVLLVFLCSFAFFIGLTFL